ncbi:MAG: MerR family transcriptional regulator [Thiomonas sp. 15-66-11]|jgi:DNA-binding transcriptional MerR regulator|uniref:Transcriptional regulator, MerR family n=1 Tax=Thiomonas delicata TaxID=364030 RepID=A0A238D890_THIDL|nr:MULTISPECIES: MerR family transcriptional regulator [Thiomonas]OZB46182.1 MAG: MerR family transcriptional regulator [Thiomonas sp. 15-66-11]SBP89548.1 Transcriptional regulator, MerR family [Thiomonas delicata]
MNASTALPPIPSKRYFTIGEVSELCGVKSHVLRYWEQEFSQLRPMKRRGNRRYYQHHEVLLIRRIRELLYEQGFTIHGARAKLSQGEAQTHEPALAATEPQSQPAAVQANGVASDAHPAPRLPCGEPEIWPVAMRDDLRSQLLALRSLLSLE